MPRQPANAPHAHPWTESFHTELMRAPCIRGIRPRFRGLSPDQGQVAYVLLTSAPVAGGSIATSPLPLDLHVLSLSLAFILSQDQTLRCKYVLSFFFRQKYGHDTTRRVWPLPLRKIAVYLSCILKRNLVCRELRNTFLVLLHLSNSFLAANISKVSLPRKTASKKSLAHLP